MNKYQFLEDRQKNPVILNYGQLGACQLLCNKVTKQLCILKLAPKGQAYRDVQCLSQMNHPNIIKIVEYMAHEDNMLVVLELLTGGDLYTKIKCREVRGYQVAPIFRGICSAVQYIHSRKIIHRNLKTQSILLDQNMNPKIIDFGLAARLSTRRTFCGCYYYMAPQILQGREYGEGVDVWALGVILYEMVYGEVPFVGDDAAEVLASIRNSGIYQRGAEKGSYDEIIRRMLCWEVGKRATLVEILQYPLLNVEPLDFLNAPKIKKNNRTQAHSSQSKKGQNRSLLQHRIRFRQKSVRVQQQHGENMTACQAFQTAIMNKIAAFGDHEKINKNPAYNFVVNP